MELMLNTYSLSLNCDNEAFVITHSKNMLFFQ